MALLRGEAVQALALMGWAVGALVAGWAIADSGGYRNDRLGAVTLGLVSAAGTTFLVLAGLWQFAFGVDGRCRCCRQGSYCRSGCTARRLGVGR